MKVKTRVEAEETVFAYTPADNGAGPLWCHGSTIVARQGDAVYVAGLETLPEHKPLHNCRWTLFRRTDAGWELMHRDTTGRTREPSPLALLGNGALLVSANPTRTELGAYSGPAEPAVFRFATDDPAAPPRRESLSWSGAPAFTEHSYRTVTADRDHNEVLYMQNVGYDVAHMAFLDRREGWRGAGTLQWPWGAAYPEPQWLRLCYPNVILRDRAAHFFGVGDIVEPVAEWRQAKFELTGRDWDYVFRRLFYAYTPDIRTTPFTPWVDIADLDATAGALRNGDIYLDEARRAHLVWSATSVDARLRDRFFPGQLIVHSLEYAVVDQGRVVDRRTLARIDADEDGWRPQLGRFHVLEDGTLLVVATFAPQPDAPGSPRVTYRVAALSEAASQPLEWSDIRFAQPMAGTFLTATVRGGSAPSPWIDLVGMRPDAAHTVGYARVRVEAS